MSVVMSPWIGVGLGLWLALSGAWLWQAEQGRKRDLVRRSYRQAPDFTLGIIVALMSLRDSQELDRLLACLAQQDYPLELVQVHVVSTLAPVPCDGFDGLNVRWWQAPAEEAPTLITPASLQVWASQRLIASDAPDLFIYLQPGDRVRFDFLAQVAGKAYEETILQGYCAIRPSRQADGWQQWQQTQARANSRLALAANHHAGLGFLLQPSGLAIKPSLLEKMPPGSGPQADWTAYTLRLLARDIPLGWAPHAVVFRSPQPSWWKGLHDRLQRQLEFLFLARRTAPFVLSTGLQQGNKRLVHVWLSLVWQGLGPLRLLALLIVGLNDLPLALTLLLLGSAIRLLGLLVARLPLQEAVSYLAGLAAYELASLPLWPLAVYERWHTQRALARKRAQSWQPSTRLNEALAPAANLLHEEDGANYHGILDEVVTRHEQTQPRPERAETEPANPSTWADQDHGEAPIQLSTHQAHTVMLSYGQREVPCELNVECDLEPVEAQTDAQAIARGHYRLTLVYKAHRFATARHDHLLAAYDELADKLHRRGFQLKSCGACAYYCQSDEQLPVAVCAYGQPAPDEPPTTADAQGHITVATVSCAHFDNRFGDSAQQTENPDPESESVNSALSH